MFKWGYGVHFGIHCLILSLPWYLISGIILEGIEEFWIFLEAIMTYKCEALSCVNVYPWIKTCVFSGSKRLLLSLTTTIPKRKLLSTTFHSVGINKRTALLPATVIWRYCPHIWKALQSWLNYSCYGNSNLGSPDFCS